MAEYLLDWLNSSRHLTPRTTALYRQAIDRWITPPVGVAQTVELGRVALADLSPATIRRWVNAVSDSTRAAAVRRMSGPRARETHPARIWARENGHQVSDTGRLSPDVLTAWEAAGSPSPRPASNGVVEPGRTTAAQAYRTLHTALEAAVVDGLIAANPCTIVGAGTVRHRERGIANPAEVVALAHAVPDRLKAAVLVAAWSGLRYGELFALARRHVDLEAGTLRVERTLGRNAGVAWGLTKTRGSVRTVTLPAFAVVELADHLARYVGRGPDALVFATASGRPYHSGNVSAAFRRARASIGRDDLTWHDLRHTGATLACRAGGSVKDVQNRLGHTTARAAMIYAHAVDDSDRMIAEKMNELYAGASNVRPLVPRATLHGGLVADHG